MTDAGQREAFTKILLTQERLILTIEAFEERISRLEIEKQEDLEDHHGDDTKVYK